MGWINFTNIEGDLKAYHPPLYLLSLSLLISHQHQQNLKFQGLSNLVTKPYK